MCGLSINQAVERRPGLILEQQDLAEDSTRQTNLEVACLRKTRLDHIRNEDTRKEAHVKPVETFLENKRLNWFGHC